MALNEVIRRARAIFPSERARGGVLPRVSSDEQPLRSELLSGDQLDVHLVDLSPTALASARLLLEALENVTVTAHQASYEAGLAEVARRCRSGSLP